MSENFNPRIEVHNGEGLTITLRPDEKKFSTLDGKESEIVLSFNDEDVGNMNEVKWENRVKVIKEISDGVFMGQRTPSIRCMLDKFSEWDGRIELNIDDIDSINKVVFRVAMDPKFTTSVEEQIIISSPFMANYNIDIFPRRSYVYAVAEVILKNGTTLISNVDKVKTTRVIKVLTKQELIKYINNNDILISDLDTSAITDLSHLWINENGNKNITRTSSFYGFDGLDVRNVTNFDYCFGHPTVESDFNLCICGWRTYSAETMEGMFMNCTSIKFTTIQGMSKIELEANRHPINGSYSPSDGCDVTTIQPLHSDCRIDLLITGKVKNLSKMFKYDLQDKSNLLNREPTIANYLYWDTSSCTNFSEMFMNSSKFIIPLLNLSIFNDISVDYSESINNPTEFPMVMWDMRKAENVNKMFRNANGIWFGVKNTPLITDMEECFMMSDVVASGRGSSKPNRVTTYKKCFYGSMWEITLDSSEIFPLYSDQCIDFSYMFCSSSIKTTNSRLRTNFRTLNGRNFDYMLSEISYTLPDMVNWNVGNMTTGNFMFAGHNFSGFDSNMIRLNWSITNLVEASGMFMDHRAPNNYTIDISSWSPYKLERVDRMFAMTVGILSFPIGVEDKFGTAIDLFNTFGSEYMRRFNNGKKFYYGLVKRSHIESIKALFQLPFDEIKKFGWIHKNDETTITFYTCANVDNGGNRFFNFSCNSKEKSFSSVNVYNGKEIYDNLNHGFIYYLQEGRDVYCIKSLAYANEFDQEDSYQKTGYFYLPSFRNSTVLRNYRCMFAGLSKTDYKNICESTSNIQNLLSNVAEDIGYMFGLYAKINSNLFPNSRELTKKIYKENAYPSIRDMSGLLACVILDSEFTSTKISVPSYVEIADCFIMNSSVESDNRTLINRELVEIPYSVRSKNLFMCGFLLSVPSLKYSGQKTEVGTLINLDTSRISELSGSFGIFKSAYLYLKTREALSNMTLSTGLYNDLFNCTIFVNNDSKEVYDFFKNVVVEDGCEIDNTFRIYVKYLNDSFVHNRLKINIFNNLDIGRVKTAAGLFAASDEEYALSDKILVVNSIKKVNLADVEDCTSLYNGAVAYYIMKNEFHKITQPTNVRYANYMFANTTLTDLNIDIFNLSNVKTCAYMFYKSGGNVVTNGIELNNVEDCLGMFQSSYVKLGGANGVISINSKKLKRIRSAFVECKGNVMIDIIDFCNITDLSGLFSSATGVSFKNINSWDMSKIRIMQNMFSNASTFNKDISGWNVENVENMSYMFYNAQSFNQNISNWNTSKVTNMAYMFYNAQSFNQNISNWNVNNVTSYSNVFTSCPISQSYKPRKSNGTILG